MHIGAQAAEAFGNARLGAIIGNKPGLYIKDFIRNWSFGFFS